MLRQFASDYLAGADPKTPLASPLFASLSGLPPLLIQVGTADLLLSDSERLATAAADAGVDVILQIGEGLPHVYQILLGTPRQPRPPSRSGSSCGPGSAHQTVHRQQASRRPVRPSLRNAWRACPSPPTKPAERHQRTRTVTTTGEAHDRPAGLSRRAELRA